MVSFRNWDPLPSILPSTKGCEVMSSFAVLCQSTEGTALRRPLAPGTVLWTVCMQFTWCQPLSSPSFCPFPPAASELLWLWELIWVWNLLLYHPPRIRCQLLLLIPHGPLFSLQLGERVARRKEMNVVVKFLIMANFLSSYHVPGPMLSTLHIWSHLILTKTLQHRHIITTIPVFRKTKLS